jgi:hypothetical protein
MTLPEALTQEIDRAREVRDVYLTIPTGDVGALVILAAIQEGEKALATGDPVRMLRAYRRLQDVE